MKFGLNTLGVFFKQPKKLQNYSAAELSQVFVQAGLEVESVESDPDFKLIFDLSITPNRGDCLSAYGIARELAAGLNLELLELSEFYALNHPQAGLEFTDIQIGAGCIRYFGQVIRDINPNPVLPTEITKALAIFGSQGSGCGLVDLLNYVMFLVGQPMHAFDLSVYSGKIFADSAENLGYAGRELKLLNQVSIRLEPKDLIIANTTQPLALAGIMGGLESAIHSDTQHIFLESACFDPIQIRTSATRHHLNSDASYRYARGVDPELAAWAMAYATFLILKYCGGQCVGIPMGGVHPDYQLNLNIPCRIARVNSILGTQYSGQEIQKNLLKLNIQYDLKSQIAKIPSFRLDLSSEIDIIEEIARIIGYHDIPEEYLRVPLRANLEDFSFTRRSVQHLKQACVNFGLNETVHYSFISPEQINTLGEWIAKKSVRLNNPLSQNWSVMRPSLLPGLIQTVLNNRDRQQDRVRLFEVGVCFWGNSQDQNNPQKKPCEQNRLAVVLSGLEKPEQWGVTKSPNRELWVDFYDLKGLALNLFHPSEHSHIQMISNMSDPALKLLKYDFDWMSLARSVLEPGLGVLVVSRNKIIGYLGKYKNPEIKNPAEFIWGLELEVESLLQQQKPCYQPISKYPSVRRDFSFVMDLEIQAEQIGSVIRELSGEVLVDFFVFDQYTGKQIPAGKKNLAIGLILQSQNETLTDQKINQVTDSIISQLAQKFNISLRE